MKMRLSKSGLELAVFWFCVVDIMFLPFIKILSISASMPLLLAWYTLNFYKLKLTVEFKYFLLFALLLTASVLLSFVVQPDFLTDKHGGAVYVYKQNIVYASILLFMFMYYFYFQYCINKYHIKIQKILYVYLIFNFLLSLYFMLSPHQFFELKSLWSMNSSDVNFEEFSSLIRFTGLFNDPNNAAVMSTALLAFLLFNEKTNLLISLLFISLISFVVVTTMSVTGAITLVFVISMFAYLSVSRFDGINKLIFVFLSVAAIATAIWIITSLQLLSVTDNVVVDAAMQRVQEDAGESGGNRVERWKRLLVNSPIFYHIIIGQGGVISLGDALLKPHNGHLYLIYGYGLLAYLIFLYTFFRKRASAPAKDYMFLIPLFLLFSINVGVYDFRYSIIMALLVATYSATNVKRFKY